jgi:hypothetical protein
LRFGSDLKKKQKNEYKLASQDAMMIFWPPFVGRKMTTR